MDDGLFMDYDVQDTCCWEPCGNSNYATRCGKLQRDKFFSPSKDRVCRFCGKPFDNATYTNMHEKEEPRHE